MTAPLTRDIPKLIVSIHQPNYAPWTGYFHKMAEADVFVFLDDVQFSKGSYINRVQIDFGGASRWLTVPIRHTFGKRINEISLAKPEWSRSHLDSLFAAYRTAVCFGDVWEDVQELYEGLPIESLSATNIMLVRRLAKKLAIDTPTIMSSSLEIGPAKGDDRLIAICKKIGSGNTYLSGRGGAQYQDETKFSAAGIGLQYTNFKERDFPQGRATFMGGLSVLDAIFHLGWKKAAVLVKP